jgi:surface antigen
MKLFARTSAVVVAGALAMSACETNEEMGQMFGALGGAALGLAIAGEDDDTMKAVAVVAGASLGAWIGGNIGRGLDERERGRLAYSTQQVLDADIPASSPLRAAAAQNASAPPAGAPSAVWESPTNPGTVSGRSTVLAVSDAPSGAQCRKVRQSVTRNGRESFEDVQLCKAPGGGWEQT